MPLLHNDTLLILNFHPESPHRSSSLTVPPIATFSVKTHPASITPHTTRRDASQQTANAAAGLVDLFVLAAARGGGGPVDVGGRDVVFVFGRGCLRRVVGGGGCGCRCCVVVCTWERACGRVLLLFGAHAGPAGGLEVGKGADGLESLGAGGVDGYGWVDGVGAAVAAGWDDGLHGCGDGVATTVAASWEVGLGGCWLGEEEGGASVGGS